MNEIEGDSKLSSPGQGQDAVDVSIVIVNWNSKQLLLDCLAAVYENVRNVSFEVWVVDNASSDGSVEAVSAKFPQVRIICNEVNLGFAAANNKALRQMAGRYALLLNTDAVLTPGAVERLYRFMEENQAAAMSCGQLLNADGSRQNSIANFPNFLTLLCKESMLRLLWPTRYPSKRQDYAVPTPVDSCIGACLMVRKKAMDEVGLLDERYFFFMEETDWALQMKKAGRGSVFIPDAQIYHLQGQSVGPGLKGRILFYRSRYQYFRKWHPKSYPLAYVLLSARLVINTALNLLGTMVTMGLHKGVRQKLRVYSGLIAWHLRGCPEDT